MQVTSETNLTIHPFRMGTDKEAALKPLEEAAEVFGAWQGMDGCGASDVCKSCVVKDVQGCMGYVDFADEIADCIQACVNLADRYGIDLPTAMEQCEERNRKRGRYGERGTPT